MLAVQREALDECLGKLRNGRISRRTFMERLISIGLTSSVATALLCACNGDTDANFSNSTVITWKSDHQPFGVYDQLVSRYNQTNKDNIHVLYQNGEIDTGQLHDGFAKLLQKGDGSIDVMSLDVIWPAEFASNGWLANLDKRWPPSEQAKYLPGPTETCFFNGHVWAVPHHIDVGLIYYRTDLFSQAPQTWQDLTDMAAGVQNDNLYGYIWQGAQYEGLVCDFIEVLYGYGGAVLDKQDPTKVVIKSPQAVQALTTMVNWVGTISPSEVTTYKEEDTRFLWQDGRAAFMRNWPYAYGPSGDPGTSRVAGKFDVHSMLYGGTNTIGHSCTGGHDLGINAYSKQQDAAWKFIQYLIGPEAQKYVTLNASLITALSSVSQDAEVLAKKPFFKNIHDTLLHAQPRPVSPKYPYISSSLQSHIHKALIRQASPADAIDNLQLELQKILSK